MRNEIKKIIQKALNTEAEVRVEYPSDTKLGDYSTNIAFLLAKEEKKNPQDVASELAKKILKDKKAKKMFKKVEAAGAGFINFTLSSKFLQKHLESVGRLASYINVGGGAKVNIEFLSANPTGKFQVGNGRIGFYGDVLGNILKLSGYKVSKEYYINNGKSSTQIRELGKTALGKGEKYKTAYVEEKIGTLGKELASLSGSEPDIFGEAGFLLASKIQKDNKAFLDELDIRFDIWTGEEGQIYNKGLIGKTLSLLKKEDLVYESEGATWLKTTKFGDDKDKVLIRSSGEYGYYLADIAYHHDKISRGYERIIDIFGADHQGHVEPIKIAMEILGYKGKFEVLISQLVQARGGGKFSKRSGNIIELEDLVEEVGADAARFFYLSKSLDTQMEFDMDLAKEQSAKNPVYYVQYAHARMASILRNAKNKYQVSSIKYQVLTHPSELKLILYLLRWPEIIEDTACDYQLQRITMYSTDLATVFNGFYRDCRVISEDKEMTRARLGLVLKTQELLKEVLGVLGISAPERM